MQTITSPFPPKVLASLAGSLSPTADAGATSLPCGMTTPQSVLTAVPCDIDMLQVTVATTDEETREAVTCTIGVPNKSNDRARMAVLDVACGKRPMQNVGAGQAADKTKFQLVRNPARVSVVATYAATCGGNGHPGIRVSPEGGHVEICEPQFVGGTKTSFEAFRRPTRVERSKLWFKGGSFLTVVAEIWAGIYDDSSAGTVVISSDSCGIRPAGPCISGLNVAIRLHSEEEVEIEIKFPAIGGIGRSKEVLSQDISTGESQVTEKGYKKKDRYGPRTETINQSFSQSEEKLTVSSFRKKSADKPEIDELKHEGFDIKLTHNGDEYGLEEMESACDFVKAVFSISKTIEQFRRLWEAGPGVEASIGWKAEFNLLFLQVGASGKWTRRLENSTVLRTLDGSLQLMLVGGSAKATYGVVVAIKRFYISWVKVDVSVSLELAGEINSGTRWSGKRVGDAPWSSEPQEAKVDGELELTFKATTKVTMCGRELGVELAAASGLEGEAVVNGKKGFAFQSAVVKSKPIVVSMSVWVCSTGEADYKYERLLFGEHPICTYPAQAEAQGGGGSW